MPRHLNYTFLVTALILAIFGILFLATLSAIESLEAFGNTNYYLFHQLVSVAIGLVAALVAYKLPLAVLKKISLPLLALNIVLLILVFIPGIGVEYWGARRWIRLFGFTLQPSELLKLTSILYLAAWLSVNFTSTHSSVGVARASKRGYENILKVFLPFLGLLAVVAFFLYLQKDLSTLGVTAAALIAVYFVARTPLWHTLLVVVGGIASAGLFIITEPYRVQRVLSLFRPDDPLGTSLQLVQSKLAIGSGGWFGRGLGMSTQKFGYLPQAMGDSIFAIIGEELGFIGCTIVIGLLVFFFWQCLKIARSSNDMFGRLAAVGIATWIIVQSFMNIASALGIFPLAGIPLPFFSYGGSHIIAELAAVGLLLNISRSK